MESIRQELNGYKIPTYVEDILTHNYCPYFLRMSMVREEGSYMFNYNTDSFRRLDISKLDLYGKLVLIRTVINMAERNGEWLIKPESYLIEPELIFSMNQNPSEGYVRILFYPDLRKVRFDKKMVLFTDKIKNENNREEREMLGKFSEIVVGGDMNRAKGFLDKNIFRIEKRIQSNAS